MNHSPAYFTQLLCVLVLLSLHGCTAMSSQNSGFAYQSIPVATGTIPTGEGSRVSFRGNRLPLTGSPLTVGEALRSSPVTRTDLSVIDITETKGNVRVISVVPSLDTRVCEQQTHYLSEKNDGLDANVLLLTISIDTPFAQARFAKEADIHNVTFLSDYRNAKFGRAHGLFIEHLYVLTRAVLVVDQQNIVRYLQVTPDLGTMPDMDTAFSVARKLASSSLEDPSSSL